LRGELLKIQWLRRVSGMREMRKTCSIVNKIEHQIPLKKTQGVYDKTILKRNSREFGANV